MSRSTVPIALFLSLVLASAAAAQTTIRVPADQPTIQAAINAAVSGDSVLVAPGTYVERIDFLGKGITVTSEAGPAATIIDGSGGGVVVTFDSGEGPGAVLRGFTVTNGGGFTGGGVAVSNASPTIEGNVITANEGCDGIGINVSFGSPSIVGNRITNNVRGGCFGGVGGAGIKISGAGTAVIAGNVIADNSLTGGDGGGISLFAAGAPVIRNNVISGNSVSGLFPAAQGGGIWIVNQSDALIVQNLIVGNSAGEGGGVYWLVPSGATGPRLVNNTIAGNLATVAGDGSAVFADGFDVNAALVNNLLIGAPGQTALHCGNFDDTNPPVMHVNDVFTLGSPAYGGLCADQTGVNGNVSVDPAFVDPATGDYRLRVGSPVVDAGDSTAADVPATDLVGDPRVVDGDGDGVAVVDMGAYERPSDRISRIASADSILAPSSRNLNDGANPRVVVDTHRTVAAFDLTGIAAAGLSRVTLRLTLAEPATSWGSAGRFVSVHRLAASFAEGNGQWFDLPSDSRMRGSGTGVTWNCAVDSSIANMSADCAALWNGGSAVAGSPSASTLHTNGLTGAVEWDVTADVLQALAENALSVQWLIRRAAENQSGRAIYHSREGAAALGNADLAPTLTFEF
jgi:parallel beta-helix repeat protein